MTRTEVDTENRDILLKHKVKYSRQRACVLSALKGTTHPLSAESVHEACRSEMKNISLSTVYRILNTFSAAGLVVRTALAPENKALFELNRHEHKHHLLCLGCSKIVPVRGCPLVQYESQLQAQSGYRIVSHKLELYGYCPDCESDNRTVLK